MARRRSKGTAILQFFQDSPLDKAMLVYEMVRDTVAMRRRLEQPQPEKRIRRTTAKSKVAPGRDRQVAEQQLAG